MEYAAEMDSGRIVTSFMKIGSGFQKSGEHTHSNVFSQAYFRIFKGRQVR
jgi:hypothetical protein